MKDYKTYKGNPQLRDLLTKTFGNRKHLANQLGVHRTTIYFWLRYGIPPDWARIISQLANGRLTIKELTTPCESSQ